LRNDDGSGAFTSLCDSPHNPTPQSAIPNPQSPRWWVYLLRCADGTLYTGCTTNLARRLAQHDAGRGARYTRGRGPVTLLGACSCADQAEALRLERRVKGLTPAGKLALSSTDAWTRGSDQGAGTG